MTIRSAALAGGALVLLVCLVVVYGCGRPPQMGADADVFRTVDALYTAVSAKNETLLGDCESRLQQLAESGKMPSSASRHLDSIIARARSGDWRGARERLHTFMSAQQRR